jgi:hypothetical protein
VDVLRAGFVRNRGHHDRAFVVRADGSETSWSFPSYDDGLPHDLVAESAFGLADGFWGHVDGGAGIERINREANRRDGRDKHARRRLDELRAVWRELGDKGALEPTFAVESS